MLCHSEADCKGAVHIHGSAFIVHNGCKCLDAAELMYAQVLQRSRSCLINDWPEMAQLLSSLLVCCGIVLCTSGVYSSVGDGPGVHAVSSVCFGRDQSWSPFVNSF